MACHRIKYTNNFGDGVMRYIKLKKDYIEKFISIDEISNLADELLQAHNTLHNQKGLCSNGAEWVDYPINVSNEEIERITNLAEKIQKKEALIVIGIGGSYLGARAAIEALTHTFYNNLGKNKLGFPEIYFAGCNIDPKYLLDLMDVIRVKDVMVNVISKSGTTFETLLAFRHIKEALYNKYGQEEANSRIVVTTGNKGILRDFANKNKLSSLSISDNISGRYSVLSPVGLLPIAVAGINIEKVLLGAKAEAQLTRKFDISNPSYQYAAIRYLLYKSGKKIEVMSYYQDRLKFLAEWYKQLFAESEGKNNKGLFPTSLLFTTDLHSLGQLLQSGDKVFFQTTLVIKENERLTISAEQDDLGSLNYLANKSYNDIIHCVQKGVIKAHYEGDSPNLIIQLDKLNSYSLGRLFYFYMKACALSSLLLDLNPFNQPGVEKYKREIKNNLLELCAEEE